MIRGVGYFYSTAPTLADFMWPLYGDLFTYGRKNMKQATGNSII